MAKRVLMAVLLGFFGLTLSLKASGEETINYDSKSSTGFYGTYEPPTEEEVEPPTETGKTVVQLQSQDGKVITLLPQTGDRSYLFQASSGLLMIGLAGSLLIQKKRNESRQ